MWSFVAVALFTDEFPSPAGRYAARASVCSCCGCRLWGTTVLKSSSLFLPVWYQDFPLCPPREGPVPSTPSFITLSPRPPMVHIITFFLKTYNAVTKGPAFIRNWHWNGWLSPLCLSEQTEWCLRRLLRWFLLWQETRLLMTRPVTSLKLCSSIWSFRWEPVI